MSLETILNFKEEEFKDKEEIKKISQYVNQLTESSIKFAVGAESFLKFREMLNRSGLEKASYFVNKPVSALSNAMELNKLYADLSRSEEEEVLLTLSFSSTKQLLNLMNMRGNKELIKSILEDYDFVRPIEFEPQNTVEEKFFPLLGLSSGSDKKIIIAEDYKKVEKNKSIFMPSLDAYLKIYKQHREDIKNKEMFLMFKRVYELERFSKIIR